MLMIPRTGRSLPSRDSSPTNKRSLRSLARSCPDRTRIKRAMGKSKKAPSFKSSAGARLTVILVAGKVKFEFIMALLTRSRDSETVLLAIPTILKAGRPLLESLSTSTMRPSKP